jgi:hypothetical protein
VISPKIEGYIKEVRAEENQPVTAGQVLFVVDDRDFAARTAQAEAAVATAEALVATYASRRKLQQAMIEQAGATVQSTEADLNRARLDFKRYTALTTSDFASRQRFETADAEWASGRREVRASLAVPHDVHPLAGERIEAQLACGFRHLAILARAIPECDPGGSPYAEWAEDTPFRMSVPLDPQQLEGLLSAVRRLAAVPPAGGSVGNSAHPRTMTLSCPTARASKLSGAADNEPIE